MLSGSEWTTILSIATATVIILTTIWKWIKKHDPKLAAELPVSVRHALDSGATFFKDLLSEPLLAGEVAAGKLEARHITDKLLQGVLSTAASQALASFKKPFPQLSQSEAGTAVEMVQTHLQGVGKHISPSQAVEALQGADKAIHALSAIANAATERSQALQNAVAPEAPATPTTPTA